MKKISAFALVLFLGTGFVYSQCNPIVSSSSIVVKVPTQKTVSDAFYWVCVGQSLTLSGNYNTLYIEDSVAVSIQGDSNTIYQKGGGNLTVAGAHNKVNINPTSTYTENGSFTTKTNCPGMVFDYSTSPSGGCDFAAGLGKVDAQMAFVMRPVPANDFLYLSLRRDINSGSLSIYSSDGKRLSQQNLHDKAMIIDVRDYPSGIYLLELQNNGSRHVQKFLVER